MSLDDVVITQSQLSTNDVNKSKVAVYQDEANGLVKISGLNDVKKVKLFDLSGKLISNVNHSEMNISNLPKGIYIVNFYTNDEVISRKIIKK